MPIAVCNFIQDAGVGGKFVILLPVDGEGGAVVAFSDFTRDFQHRHIVERWRRSRAATASHRVAGGGWWKLERATLVLYGQSADFGPFDRDWLRRNLRPGTVLNETVLDIR